MSISNPGNAVNNPFGEERTIIRRHRHWIVLVRKIALPFIATLLVAALVLYSLAQSPNSPDPATYTIITALGVLVLALLIFWTVYTWLDWDADWIELTTWRVRVQESKPLRSTTNKEVPLLKVQNVVSRVPTPIHKELNYGKITIDTAGLGTITFDEVHDPDGLRVRILAEQKNMQAVSRDTRDKYIQYAVRHVIYQTPSPPQPPSAAVLKPVDPPEGFNTFNQLFPFQVQRRATSVIWHRHWWFLVLAELTPVLLIVVFELVTFSVKFLLGVLNGNDPGIGVLLDTIRPFVWFVVLLVALYQWEDWRNERYIIQDDRLIVRTAKPLGIYEETSETKLDRITDLRDDVPNLLAMTLDFGDVVIRTPGESVPFRFAGVPHPRAIVEEITRRDAAIRDRTQVKQWQEYQDWLQAYNDNLRQWYEQRAAQQQQPP